MGCEFKVSLKVVASVTSIWFTGLPSGPSDLGNSPAGVQHSSDMNLGYPAFIGFAIAILLLLSVLAAV